MTTEDLQTRINNQTSNMIRHQGNVLELQKQVIQTQAELDYERDQFELCISEIGKLKILLQSSK